MDIDRFIARNQPAWHRLDELSGRASRGLQRLAPAEVDELVETYQRVSSHLAHARVAYRDPALTARLTRLVGRANGVIYASRSRPVQAISDFFAWRFPAAVWQSGRFVAVERGAAAGARARRRASGWRPTTRRSTPPPPRRCARRTWRRTSSRTTRPSPPSQFATEVTVNNIQVAFTAFATGALLCVPAAALMVFNGANVGVRGRAVRRRRASSASSSA